MRHDLSHLEPDLHHHFKKNQHEFDSLHERAEKIRRHHLWMMILSLAIFLFVLGLLIFAVPNYIANITTPDA
jgi:hypothetical protein